jgi:hypothetical protein
VDDECRAILEAATDIQRRYVMARVLGARGIADAARQLHIHRSTPHQWDNLEDLERVVISVQIDQVDGARWALTNLSVEAVQALQKGLGERSNRIPAANSILDRVGIPKQSAVDVTSKGQSLTPIQFVEIDSDASGEDGD